MTTPMPIDPMGSAVAGAADLQSSIDRLNGSIQNLTTSVQRLNNGNGTTTSPAMSAAAGGATFTSGTYAGAGGGGVGYGGGFNGSGGQGGANPYSFASGASGLLGSGSSLAQGIVNAASSAVNSGFTTAARQLNTQATINTYGYTQAAFWSTSSTNAIANNFGGGYGSSLRGNNLALNASDANIGGQMLSQISGQQNYTAASGPTANGITYGRGNAAYQFAAATGLANPGLGMTGSASVASALFNPSTSYNLMMMGIGTTPLQVGKGTQNSMASVEQAIGNRFGFGGGTAAGTFDNNSLQANLTNPLFQMQMMQATGMSATQYQQWAQQWGSMNTWVNSANAKGKNVTMNQMQQQIAAYMSPTSASAQKTALSQLQGEGVSLSMLQTMNQSNALQTGVEAGGNAAFSKGVAAAADTINQFTAALAQGLQTMEGALGALGAVGSLNATGVVGAGSGATSAAIGSVGSILSGSSSLATIKSDLSSIANLVGLSGTPAATGSSGGKGGSGGTSGSMGSAVGGSAKANQALGQKMAAAMGWTGSEWTALNNVMMHESGWITNNQNPSSTAFGIGQFLDSTWGIYDHITKAQANNNPKLQIQAMLDYVKGRYGKPSKAWAGYFGGNLGGPTGYSDGTTSAKPGIALVGERGPEMVALSGGQQIINSAQTAKMLQPTITGTNGKQGGGVSVVFQSGAISITGGSSSSTKGYHTSGDVQPNAQQLVQAIETALSKSAVLRDIAAGVTG